MSRRPDRDPFATKVALVVWLGPIFWALFAWIGNAPAFATSCSGQYRYVGYNTTYSHNEGVEGDIHYDKDDMLLSNDSRDHAAIDITDESHMAAPTASMTGYKQAG